MPPHGSRSTRERARHDQSMTDSLVYPARRRGIE